jgi:hypothetical protein
VQKADDKLDEMRETAVNVKISPDLSSEDEQRLRKTKKLVIKGYIPPKKKKKHHRFVENIPSPDPNRTRERKNHARGLFALIYWQSSPPNSPPHPSPAPTSPPSRQSPP